MWAGAGLAGLTALLATSTVAYDAVRIAGACYLVWLGLSGLWRTLPRNRVGVSDGHPGDGPTGVSVKRGLRAGFVTNLLNPKVGVFHVSLLPQFLPVGPGAAGWGALLVAIHLAVTFVWYPVLIVVAARVRAALLRERVRAWFERITACVLIGVGLRLASDAP